MIATAATATALDVRNYDAALFDLDGVVTDTASSHAASWQRLFDEFLSERSQMTGEKYTPFDPDRDYVKYVDGKPRYDGAQSFLESRSITPPFGDPGDPPGHETICALGNRKNELFQQHLEEHGVEVFPATIRLIEALREQGVKTAIISSSKNCEPVLRAAGIAHLFDAKVDGADLVKLGLEGKPDPAVFLRAAEELGVEPRRAIIIEDAISGVEAGREGGFSLVIGIDRRGEGDELRKRGADIVVNDLEEIVLENTRQHDNITTSIQAESRRAMSSEELLSALEAFDEIAQRLRGRKAAVFLDYDGTLTPIVERPEDAVLSDAMRESVRRLTRKFPVAIISGRDLPDVRKRVGIDNVFYAGSHGFDIEGPAGFEARHEAGDEFLPLLDEAERSLHDALDGMDGAQIERKRYSIAVHYRRVRDDNVASVEGAVRDMLSRHKELRLTHGKKVFDLQPAIDWHKGRAVEWLIDAMKLDRDRIAVIYIGDDVTDEDAFRALHEHDEGIGIIVADEPRNTEAAFALRDQNDVAAFLEQLDGEL